MQGDLLDPRTAFATRTPEGAHDHTGVIERVIEMDGDSPEIDAANAGNGRLSVEGSGTWKRRDDLERLFEFLGEHVGGGRDWPTTRPSLAERVPAQWL